MSVQIILSLTVMLIICTQLYGFKNFPKVTHEPITIVISNQLDIKLGQFMQEELDLVLRKIKNRKAAGLDEISLEVWKTRESNYILLRHCNVVYN